MSDEERLARLEAGFRLLSSRFRATADRQAQADMAALEARLMPSLPSISGARDAATRDPELGSPLMDRLAADASLAYSAAGSSLGAKSSANALADPTFVTVPYGTGGGNTTMSSAWQDFGPFWEARVVLQAGVYPSTRILSSYWGGNGRFYSGRTCWLVLTWGSELDAGQVTVELRTKVTTNGQLEAVAWPWMVGAMRLYLERDIGPGAVSAVLDLLEGGVSVVQSDELDLAALAEVSMEGLPVVSLADPNTVLTLYKPQLQLTVTVTADGDPESAPRSVAIGVGEPQLQYTDEESPPPFQPDIGRWNPVPYDVGIRLVREADVNVADDSAWHVLNFNDTSSRRDYDSGGFYSSALPGRVTIPITGIYQVTPHIEYATGGGTGDRQVRIIRYSGASSRIEKRWRVRAAGSGVSTVGGPARIFAMAGDYIQTEMYQNSGGTIAALGSTGDVQTCLEVGLLGWFRGTSYSGGGDYGLAG